MNRIPLVIFSDRLGRYIALGIPMNHPGPPVESHELYVLFEVVTFG